MARAGGVLAAGAVARSAATTRAAGTSDAAGSRRYQLRQRLVSIGDDFRITDQDGNLAYLVDGKALRVRSTLLFLDPAGTELYRIQEKVLRVRDSMSVQRPDGSVAARVHNALLTPLRDRWTIDVPGGDDLQATGNILDHEYRIRRGGTTVASVSRRWFRVRDTYGVEIAAGEDAALLLSVVVVIDMMAHPGR
ncbi:MAG: hypothetical protein EA340_10210 [Nitriliruptor sp.]|nr:MAG: hypothetical protein EA340_10210 [Nitriliruptor sp.]